MIEHVLNNYYRAWNQAFISKDPSVIRSKMSKQFSGYWSNSKLAEPYQYGYDYDLLGVLNQYTDAEKSIDIESIAERGNDFIVTGKEISMVNGESHSAQVMLIWRHEHQEWKLLREYIEMLK